jgi:hypothetical protein
VLKAAMKGDAPDSFAPGQNAPGECSQDKDEKWTRMRARLTPEQRTTVSHFIETWKPEALKQRATLQRKILERDGGVCQVPGCSRAADHVHHIRYRSAGGPTIPLTSSAPEACTTSRASTGDASASRGRRPISSDGSLASGCGNASSRRRLDDGRHASATPAGVRLAGCSTGPLAAACVDAERGASFRSVLDPGRAIGDPALIRFYRRVARAYGEVGLGFKIAIVAGFVVMTTAVGIGMVLSIPADHFKRGRQTPAPARRRHPLLRWSASLVRNVFGAVLVTLGAIMALPLVPGPGLVFILLGLSVLDFPGKHAMQRRLMRVPGVTRFMNDVRARFGKAPLILDDAD